MKINIKRLLLVMSDSLNFVEEEFLGITTGHTQRVTYLCMKIGHKMKLTEDELMDFLACAILHDNAIPHYIEEEYLRPIDTITVDWVGKHCVVGEYNVSGFPFVTDITGIIRYHHERANGTGPLHRREEDTPFLAQVLHICDAADRFCFSDKRKIRTYDQLIHFLKNGKGILYGAECVNVFCEHITQKEYDVYMGETIRDSLKDELPQVEREYTYQQVKPIAELFAKIIDYKSEYTGIHSVQLAAKAQIMAEYYNMPQDEKDQFYIAALLHDLGKFAIANDILEKNGKLSYDEYEIMKNHAYYTYSNLSSIHGFDKITEWASNHHEKLNGSGYPFGKTADQLDRNSRLLACLDIYQALTEERSYKKGMKHEESIYILYEMVARGELDGALTAHIDRVFGNYA